jgi:putative hemolysin
MIAFWCTISGVFAAALASLFFSTLTYSLRDFSRSKLVEYLERHGKSRWLEPTMLRVNDLVFVTALGRMLANLLILIFVLHALNLAGHRNDWIRYLLGTIDTAILSVFCSVAIPHALSRHAAEGLIGFFVRFLHFWRAALLPMTTLMNWIDRLVGRISSASRGEDPVVQKEEDIAQEIVSAVEEAEKEGVVDETEREMIESVIEFRDTHVGQIMTSRPDIMALESASTLQEVKKALEESGHSRLPVYEGTLDRIVGILYARDLLKHLGEPPEQFDIRSAMRAAFYVPKTKPLRDLLSDFRLQKVHLAIVLDEYGGTAGLVTIEDVLEELVGEISDEHEPAEPPMFKRVAENVAEADARIYLEELNRLLGLNLPEDQGYDTLGGFVSTTLGSIPKRGHSFVDHSARFTILDAEPQKVNRVKIEILPTPVSADSNPFSAP